MAMYYKMIPGKTLAGAKFAVRRTRGTSNPELLRKYKNVAGCIPHKSEIAIKHYTIKVRRTEQSISNSVPWLNTLAYFASISDKHQLTLYLSKLKKLYRNSCHRYFAPPSLNIL